MMDFTEINTSENFVASHFTSPVFSSALPPFVSPPLMPHNIFPDPSETIKNKLLSSLEMSEESIDSGLENPQYDVADIFRLYWKDFQITNPVTERQFKVVYDILNCRTGAFGYCVSACDVCGHREIFPNSCRNSHCPGCQGRKRDEWVQARLDDLLPVPYYHAVFTLPNKIFPLCLYNQQIIYDLLFRSAAETLQEFGYDTKWLGGQTGFFMVLHTWGQLLSVHPHVHCVIPAGAYNKDTCEWVHPKYEKNNFLFPVHALSKVFRGKFIHGLKQAFRANTLKFPGDLKSLQNPGNFESYLNDLVSTNWVVYSKAPFSGPEDVVRYVGRYTHRVAISNSRIISIDNGIIRFTFKNYKKTGKVENYSDLWEETELPADEFIRRFLYHVLPLSYNRIRYYGFMSTNNNALFQEIWEYLVMEEEAGFPKVTTETYTGIDCPKCENGVLVPLVIVDGSGKILKGSFTELSQFCEERKKLLKFAEEAYANMKKPESPELVEAWDTS